MLKFAAVAVLFLVGEIAGDAFVPGQQYTYNYHGQILTGIPGIEHHYSGLGINHKIIIQAKNDHLIFRFDDIKVDKVNKQTGRINEYTFNYRPSVEYSEHLTKPFKVYYEDGLIKKFYVTRQEPEWSVNLKKAILSTFQVNLQQYNPMRIQKGNYLVRPDPDANYFRVIEDGIGGECETLYNIASIPDVETPYHNKVLNVTKVRNYSNCKYRPQAIYSNVYGTDCQDCKSTAERKTPLQSHGSTYYNIRGDRYHFLIEKAYTEGETVFTPFTTNGQSIITFVNQTIELSDIRSTPSMITADSDLVAIYTLSYKFPRKIQFRDLVDLREPHSIYSSHGYHADVGAIGALFDTIAKSYKNINIQNDLTHNYTTKYNELVKQFTTLSYDKINRLYNQYANYNFTLANQDQKAQMRLFIDVLTDTGTNPAYSFIKHLLQTSRIHPTHAIKFFTKFSYVSKEPTETLLDDFFRLCAHQHVAKLKDVQVSCYFSFARLIKEHCTERTNPTGPSTFDRSCTPEITQKYVNYLKQKLDQSYTDEENIVFLAAIGVTGHHSAVTILKPYITGNKFYPLHIRQQAIWVLNEVGKMYPEEVISVTSPVVFNRSEDHEIRIAAFTVLIATRPSLYHFYDIIKIMKYDDNYNVQNYIYTTLQYLANSTHPCHVKVAENARLVFEVLKASNYTPVFSPSYSFQYINAGYNPKYDYGGYTSLSYIASNVSYVPRAAHVRINDYMSGLSTEPLEFGFRAQGLDKVLDKIFGPNGLLYEKTSAWDILSRRPRSVDNIKKELKEIQEALTLVPREYEPIIGHLYIMRYGSPLQYFSFDETTFQDFFKTNTIAITDVFAYLKNGIEYHNQMYTLAVDFQEEVPTEFGLSVLLDVQIPTQTSINFNKIKVKVEPSPFAQDRNNRPPTKVRVESDGKLTTETIQLVSLSTFSPFEKIKYGAGYERRQITLLPLKGSITYDITSKKFETEYEPLQEEVFYVHFEPTTFIDSYANQVSLQEETSNIPIGIHKFNHFEEKSYGQEYLGIGLQTKFRYYGFFYDKPAFNKFFQEHDWRSTLYYFCANPTFTPYKYRVKVTPATTRATNKIYSTFQWKYYDLASRDTYTPVHAKKDQEFETYTTSAQSKRAQTIAVTTNIKTVGGYERKLDVEFVYQWSFDYLYHRYGVYAVRTPFTTTDSNTKYCLNGRIRLPEREWQKIAQLRVQDITTKYTHKVDVAWGTNCESDKKIEIVSEGDRTEEQMQYIRDLATLRSHYQNKKYPYTDAYPHPADVKYNPYADLYFRCLHLKSTGFVMNYDCLYFVQKTTEPLKFDATIKYQNIPEYFTNYTMKWANMLSYRLYPHVEYYFKPTGFNRPQGQMKLSANSSAHYPVFDVRVETPQLNVNYDRVYVPFFYPMSTIYPYAVKHGYLQNYYTNYKHLTYSTCTFDKYIQTFVNNTYEPPYTGCYHVLAKDCSPEELFTVLLAKASTTSDDKNLRVLLKEHTVELLSINRSFKVRVNGKAVSVRPTEPYFQYKEYAGRRYVEFIVRVVDGIYFVEVPRTGIYVHFDGKNGAVFLSNYYKGKQCGLCGNMNGRKDHTQYSGPGNCFYTDKAAFTYSYAIPTSTCKIPAFEKSTVCDVNPIKNTFPEEVCTLMRNKIIYGKDFEEQVCFSKNPLPKCNRRCKPTRMLKKSVEFHCLSSRDNYAKRMIGYLDQRVLYELRDKVGDKKGEVEYPESCVSEYQ